MDRAGVEATQVGYPEAGQTDQARRVPGERARQRLAAGRPRADGTTRNGADPAHRATGDHGQDARGEASTVNTPEG
ncbi:hypothetical protein Van01_23870 [Micromonospora andamanensis]|uniref:Uncharacterized protein n=1 Tax=Micromonospora andamanensis TaxID=1287068 RepID=A0ABQ4HU42_9ACTN|nr:hypothetical protein Van01_23870 [Micromonospora andamanensis]